MSKIEKFILIFIGFFIFEIIFIRIGFFLGGTIGQATLPAAFIIYTLSLIFIFAIFNKLSNLVSLLAFGVVSVLLIFVAILLGKTFDTSWDGQGYHQSAVIALARGWNPVSQPHINFSQTLPSQIFAEGYPDAIWEMQASIYSLLGYVNTAKVIALVFLIIAFGTVYSLLRKLKINKLISIFISLLVCMEPIFVIQLLSFMQDGVGYELIVIAVSSLVIFIIDKRAYWSAILFISSEIMLVSAKYSFLPLALVLGLIFMINAINRFLNKDYLFNLHAKLFIFGGVVVSIIFAYLPYARNMIFYHSPFYPTNEPNLIGSVRYNNLPHNLENNDKLTLFLYGIFGKSQTSASGDTRSAQNQAYLKIPFTFSLEEVSDSASLYNNRVGASGPIFSGIVIVCIILLLWSSFKASTQTEKYAIYSVFFALGVITLISLTIPTPNLLRYVSQILLIPFVVTVPLIAVFRDKVVKVFSYVILVLVGVNVAIFSVFVVKQQIDKNKQMTWEFEQMRNFGTTYKVKAQHFYSNYILLTEQDIPYEIVDKLNCEDSESLVASSTTTQYCKIEN